MQPAHLQKSNCADEMFELVRQLYPICRSITGNGVRETLRVLQGHIPLNIQEVPTGKQVFDWTVPKEWNVRDAYIKNSKGEKIIDFRRCNLHVLNYSLPVNKTMSRDELRAHTFTLPDRPDWIPYRTSYYQENWGFCLSHKQLTELRDDEYQVFIESTLQDGHLTYGECSIKGQTDDEVLISTHVCHPSLANDNLSGIAVATFLIQELQRRKTRYSYRFLFIPTTFGAVTWLHQNRDHVDRIKHGMVLTGLGDAGTFTYKRSRRGDAEVDR